MSSRFFLGSVEAPPRRDTPGSANAFRDGGADVLGERHAISHRGALDRNERDDVDGADAGVLAAVLPQVDGVYGDVEERERGGLERGRVADERED